MRTDLGHGFFFLSQQLTQFAFHLFIHLKRSIRGLCCLDLGTQDCFCFVKKNIKLALRQCAKFNLVSCRVSNHKCMPIWIA